MKLALLSDTGTERRAKLTREKGVTAAIDLADRDGIEAVSMRRLAQELQVEAMSLYTHVRNKDDPLDGMIDAVIRKITTDEADWKSSLRRTVLAARDVVVRHSWAPRTLESRTIPGPAVLQYFNAVIGILREGGFPIALTHYALHILGSRVLGFSHDLFDDSPDLDPEAAAELTAQLGATLPYAAEMAVAVTHDGVLGACDDDAEFEFSLDFTLEGLDRLRSA